MGCHFLLWGIFPTQGPNPGLSHCWHTPYHLSHLGSHLGRMEQISKITARASCTYMGCTMLPNPCMQGFVLLKLNVLQREAGRLGVGGTGCFLREAFKIILQGCQPCGFFCYYDRWVRAVRLMSEHGFRRLQLEHTHILNTPVPTSQTLNRIQNLQASPARSTVLKGLICWKLALLGRLWRLRRWRSWAVSDPSFRIATVCPLSPTRVFSLTEK